MINVVDAMMGTGKTSAMINYIKEHPDNKYIYITPYLTEVNRINTECKFCFPIKYTNQTPKKIDLLHLLNKGENIVTTHSMFHYFDDEIIDICRAQNYILVMDEVTDVVEPYNINATDLDVMLNNYVTIQDDGILKWNTTDTYNGKFAQEKNLCDMGCLALYNKVAMLWLFPVKIFEAFTESYILTYMFNGQPQKYYYDFYHMTYNYLHVAGNSLDTYHFVTEPVNDQIQYDYSNLINIVQDAKLNDIGELNGSLSKGWYGRNQNNVVLKHLKNNTLNFFNNKPVLWNGTTYVKSSSEHNLWTTFSDYKKSISGAGYIKGYLPCNCRATNEYRDRTVVAYLVNRYINPVVKNFFVQRGIAVDEDAFALSEMIQFIWRSGIRQGDHITVYIPSKRMRELFAGWLASLDKIKDI